MSSPDRAGPERPLRFLFVRSRPHLPDRFGGVQLSTDQLCYALSARGHDCAVLAKLDRLSPGNLGAHLRLLVPGQANRVHDRVMGYPTYRRRRPGRSLAPLARAFAPDVVVVNFEGPVAFIEACLKLPLPTLFYLHNVDYERMRPVLGPHPNTAFIANGPFLADRFRQFCGLSAAIVPPLCLPDRYRVRPERRTVLFVNPVPDKGLDIALALARRRPDIPFEFVEGWRTRLPFAVHARATNLANVTWRRSMADMRPLYAAARIVLVPSRFEETWGRTVTEAQISGIPVLASRHGALPATVGAGGILVDPAAGIDAWEAALARLWDDAAAYRDYGAAALAHAARPEVQPDAVIEAFLRAASRVVRSDVAET